MTKQRFLFLYEDPSLTEKIIDKLVDERVNFRCNLVNNQNEFLLKLSEFNPNIIFVEYPFATWVVNEAINVGLNNDSKIPIIVFSKSVSFEKAMLNISEKVTDYINFNSISRLGHAVKNILELNRLRDTVILNKSILENNLQSYSTLIEQASDAIFKGNYAGDFSEVNNAACILTGYTREELLSMNMSDIFSKEELQSKPLQYNRVDNGESVINERNIVSKTGRTIPIEMNSKLIDANSYFCIIRDLTEKHKIEKQIETREERISNIIEHSSNLFYSHNIDGKFTYVSPKTEEFFDCDPDYFINMRSSLYTDNPINEQGRLSTQRAIETGESQPPFKLELIGKIGRKIWVEANETPIKVDGKVTSIVGALVDITESKKISDSLITSEKKFRTLFSEAPDPIFVIDENGMIIDCNSAFCLLIEGEQDEIINTHVTEYLPEEELNKFKENFPVLKEVGKFEIELYLKTLKNRLLLVRRSISALYDDDGRFIGAISHTHDITEQTKIQNKIKIREEQLSTVLNASPDIICFKDGHGRWLMANKAMIELFQIEKHDYFEKKNYEIAKQSEIYNNYFLNCNETDEIAWEKKNTTIIEEQILTMDGAVKTIEVIKVPVYHPNGSREALVVLGRDITKRRQLETQLQHAQKMEAIGLMASGIAHNFNNILQSIVAYIDFAKDGLDHTTQRWEDIEQIKKHVKRATLLTKSLLAVGKEQFMNKREIDINDIILPIVEATNRNNRNDIFVEFVPQKSLPSIVADGGQVDQVIMNLFINARDAMPNGGIIKVVTSSVSISEEFCLSNTWAKPGSYVQIGVSDNGHGMDSDTKRRIFEPYFTTKGLDKGIGLGLSTAFGIISQHKGLINVISKENMGTTFNIYLPYLNNLESLIK
ncbi:MAG: PAS domain S-box protein [Bacteroidetes bacterium]|nr:PAS domain S-box protein [Bacteroidota bacterium]